MADTNIFPRLSGPDFNIDVRNSGEAIGSPFKLVASVEPARIRVGEQAIVMFVATQNDVPLHDVTVNITNSNPSVGVTPGFAVTQSGSASFAFIALDEGTTNISGTMTVGSGVVYGSNVVTINTNEIEQSENYSATGYGRIVFNIEPFLAQGLYPRIERLSHEDQYTRFLNDSGLQWASYFANAEVEFIPAFLQPLR